jgi:membrane protein YqaA with SNARE-associated domain
MSSVGEIGVRRLAVRAFAGVGVTIVALVLLALLLKGPLTRISVAFIERFGATGLAMATLLADASPIPIMQEPLLLLAHAAGMPFWPILIVAGTASMLAGPVGYLGGKMIGELGPVARWIDRAGLRSLMSRHGVWLVAVAAVTPIPYAATTWTAGATGIKFLPFFAVCGLRFVKVGVYLGLMVLGWSAAV